MTHLDSSKFSSTVVESFAPDRFWTLDVPLTRNEAVQSTLDGLRDEDLFAFRAARDPEMAALCRAGLWLYHDFWDAAHAICREIETPSGFFWHAICHRRELDFESTAHWFEAVEEHPAFEPLCEAAAEEAEGFDEEEFRFLRQQSAWDPLLFLGLVEKCVNGTLSPKAEDLCVRIQRAEWELLFDYCFEEATA